MNNSNLWVLYPRPDSFVHAPGGQLKIDLTVQNLSDTALYFSKVEVDPSWAEGKRGIKPIDKKEYLPARSSMFLTDLNLEIPAKAGLYSIKFGLETWVYNYYTADWKNLGVLWTSDWGYIQVTPKPIYKVFVSRSNRPEDSPVVEQILNMIRLWGFEITTVGINKFSEDPLKIPNDIKRTIDESDAVIAIATPRDYSLQEKAYKTFTWIHIESEMAFDSDKPLLFIVDERIKPEGLLEFPNFLKVIYHPTKLEVLEHKLAIIMPGFRSWIADEKQQQFRDGLVKAGLILGGIWLVGKISEDSEDSFHHYTTVTVDGDEVHVAIIEPGNIHAHDVARRTFRENIQKAVAWERDLPLLEGENRGMFIVRLSNPLFDPVTVRLSVSMPETASWRVSPTETMHTLALFYILHM